MTLACHNALAAGDTDVDVAARAVSRPCLLGRKGGRHTIKNDILSFLPAARRVGLGWAIRNGAQKAATDRSGLLTLIKADLTRKDDLEPEIESRWEELPGTETLWTFRQGLEFNLDHQNVSYCYQESHAGKSCGLFVWYD